MTDEKPLKSSLELAMERLAKRDADTGSASQPMTDAQKAAIAEVRNFYEAKIAELEVLHHSKVAGTLDATERQVLTLQYQRERDHFVTARDAKIEKLRRG